MLSSYAIGIPPPLKKCAGAGNGNTEPRLSAPKARLLTLVVVAIAAQLVGCASTVRQTPQSVGSTGARQVAMDDVKRYMARTPDEERYRLVLSLTDQKMALLDGQTVVATYAISTSIKPPSEALNSGGTPRGLHVISEKLGAGQPHGMIFKGREPTGVISELDPEGEPPVVTRLFRLRGLESSNQNSHERLIYLHGSPHEKLLGKPASGGCIRMSSTDVVSLFEQVEVGTSITLLEEALPDAIATAFAREQAFRTFQQKVLNDIRVGNAARAEVHDLCKGHMYGLGIFPQNYFEAERWCRGAAQLGSLSALVLLGEIREFGLTGKKSIEDATVFYRHAASRGHSYAQRKLAALTNYAKGKD
jgi:hypothetical protein